HAHVLPHPGGDDRHERHPGARRKPPEKAHKCLKGDKKLKKKAVSIALVLALALTLCLFSGCGSDKVTLNVYNWGINIADGTDDYIDVVALFEETYPDIDVN